MNDFVRGALIGWWAGNAFHGLISWLAKKRMERETKKSLKRIGHFLTEFREKLEAHHKEIVGVTKTTGKMRDRAEWN